MQSEDPKRDQEALVERWFDDLFNQGELSVADDILAADVEYTGPKSLSPQDVSGPADIKEYVEVYQTAFPDLWYTIEDVAVADGAVRVRWSVTGTHRSELFGIEPTGEAFTVDGINEFVLEDGLITEVYAQWDTLKMVQELGVVPPVDGAGE